MHCVKISSSVRAVTCADETIVLDADRGVFYRFNATATALWIALETVHDPDIAIAVAADTVCRRYNANSDQVQQDLAALLVALQRNGLIKDN